MKIGKTLKNVIIAGTFALCGIGCSENNFSGKIGGEKVRFYEGDDYNPFSFSPTAYWNTLEVIKEDGSKVEYKDINRDFTVDSVKITKEDNVTKYGSSKNPITKEFLEKAQKDFNFYMTKIIDIQDNSPDKK